MPMPPLCPVDLPALCPAGAGSSCAAVGLRCLRGRRPCPASTLRTVVAAWAWAAVGRACRRSRSRSRARAPCAVVPRPRLRCVPRPLPRRAPRPRPGRGLPWVVVHAVVRVHVRPGGAWAPACALRCRHGGPHLARARLGSRRAVAVDPLLSPRDASALALCAAALPVSCTACAASCPARMVCGGVQGCC